MARKRRSSQGYPKEAAEVTREVTGNDAPPDTADAGNVGAGDAPETADDIEQQFQLEEDPSHAEDIAPDDLRREASSPEEEERELTAQPRPEDEARPITPDLLPTGEPDAATE